MDDLFGWREKGIGHRVDRRSSDTLAHEVLFEDHVSHVTHRPLFVGHGLTSRRFLLAFLLIFSLLGILGGRAFWMQIHRGASYRARAEENRLRVEILSSRRGIIRDRRGVVLAENIPSFDIHLIPSLVPRVATDRDGVLGALGREIGQTLAELDDAMTRSTRTGDWILLSRDIPYEQAIRMRITFADVPSVQVVSSHTRLYSVSSRVQSVSHLLGYVGPISREELERNVGAYRQTDAIGKTGIESSAETALRGRNGERVYEVDARNRITSFVNVRPPVDGVDVSLTIDLRLQEQAEQALRERLHASALSRGAVVAMDPRDGSILALVSLPAYNNNALSGTVSSTYYASLIENADRPLVPRAWAGVYPSGSTIKPVIATAALAERVISADTTINSVGGIHIGASFFPDWKAGGHGTTNVRKAIALSVNTFFYYLGGGYDSFIGLGVDRLSLWMRRFGLGTRTGLDLPGESAGFVPSKQWKQKEKGERWYVGDTYNLSIGQGELLVTPLQIATVTSEIANGGKKITPHVMENRVSQVGRRQTLVDDPFVIHTVQLGMRDAIIYGSGRALASFPVKVAGKTGTAQWRKDKPNHAWFTAFAPFENPEIVVTVLVEEGGEGSSVALPIAREVLAAWVRNRTSESTKKASSS